MNCACIVFESHNIIQLYKLNKFCVLHSALPTPPRNVSATPIPSLLTSLLVEWVEPEYIDGTFGWYQVVCGTQTSYSHSVAMTTVEVTGLSMFTTYTCCVSVQNVVYTSAQECVNATTYLGM